MKKILYFILISAFTFTAKAQNRLYDTSSIADSLKQNAYSVIREYNTNVEIASNKQGEYSFKKVVTILNEQGKSEANFIYFSDLFHSFNSFKGELYDATGVLISTIKKSDLKTSAISEGLASDDKIFFYECTRESYPFTMVYEWKLKYKNGFLAFPSFLPVSSYNQSLQTAHYSLTLPQEIKINYKTNLPQAEPQITISADNKSIYKWEFSPQPAIEHEEFGPDLYTLIPKLYTEPTQFIYGDYTGRQNSWEELAQWQYSLLTGRDILPPAMTEKVKQMTAHLTNDRAKVQKLYDYLGEATRYVSIQLGIGGLQPMQAEEVTRSGFGDCKALSNYLKAMLQVIGITSDYTVISTTNEELFSDYPNIQQMDHVILRVPLKEQTLWLECTNPSLPFGYIHSNIAGHDALIIKEKGGILERLPNYPDSLQLQSYKVNVKLADDPTTSAEVTCTSHLSQYESRAHLVYLQTEEQINDIRKQVKLPQASITNIRLKENKTPLPHLSEHYTLKAMYGNKNGNRLFIPVNPFRQAPFTFSKKERKQDVYLRYGYMDRDTIQITIPTHYKLESRPKNINEQHPFGSLTSYIQVTDDTIIVTQSLHIRRGVYKAKQIAGLIQFSNAIKKAYNGKIILKKQD